MRACSRSIAASAREEDVTGPVLVPGAVGAVAGGGGAGLPSIGLAVSVGEFAGPKVPPPGLKNLDLLFPCM